MWVVPHFQSALGSRQKLCWVSYDWKNAQNDILSLGTQSIARKPYHAGLHFEQFERLKLTREDWNMFVSCGSTDFYIFTYLTSCVWKSTSCPSLMWVMKIKFRSSYLRRKHFINISLIFIDLSFTMFFSHWDKMSHYWSKKCCWISGISKPKKKKNLLK